MQAEERPAGLPPPAACVWLAGPCTRAHRTCFTTRRLKHGCDHCVGVSRPVDSEVVVYWLHCDGCARHAIIVCVMKHAWFALLCHRDVKQCFTPTSTAMHTMSVLTHSSGAGPGLLSRTPQCALCFHLDHPPTMLPRLRLGVVENSLQQTLPSSQRARTLGASKARLRRRQRQQRGSTSPGSLTHAPCTMVPLPAPLHLPHPLLVSCAPLPPPHT